MSRAAQRAKPKSKAKTTPARRRKLASKRRPVPRKATNWLHARARDVKRGQNVRGTIMGLLGSLTVVLVLGLWLSGGLGEAIQSTRTMMTNRLLAAGFKVEYIEVVGPSGDTLNARDKIAVRRALAVEEGELVFAVNLNQARRRIEDLGWIKEARIMRQLPNRLTVIVVERAPFALWQSAGKWQVVSENGKTFISANARNFPTLPLVVGKGGAEALQEFLQVIQNYPRLAARVQAYVRISDRRWNLRLDNGADLMLPAQNPAQVMEIFEHNAKAAKLLSLPLKRIDARLPGQIYVRPGVLPPPASEHEAERLS